MLNLFWCIYIILCQVFVVCMEIAEIKTIITVHLEDCQVCGKRFFL